MISTEINIGHRKLELVQGDITNEKTQAIVTAANSGLLGGGGVDGAIHRACGASLLKSCLHLGGCETGQAVITESFDLNSTGVKNVIHAVGPVWKGGKGKEATALASAYRKSLELCEIHRIPSIAFPSISTGVYGYPVGPAAKIALETCKNFLEERAKCLGLVRMVLFDGQTFSVFGETLSELR